MANEEQLSILRQGVDVWNEWREKRPGFTIDLGEADLYGAELPKANLWGADLRRANLRWANLREANLSSAYLLQANLSSADLYRANLRANLQEANLREAQLLESNLSEAALIRADLWAANLGGAKLLRANLQEANLTDANLNGADLSEANLSQAQLVNTHMNQARISGSCIYGINVWDLQGEIEEQKDLVITRSGEPVITVDDVKVAQFIYLILNNEKLRDVINTITSKSVLILGRFALSERKEILDALRGKLREYNLLPIVFDFDRPTDKDFTETIKTLAGLSLFVIADVTNPKSAPLELQATVPDYQIPFVPIIQEGEDPFAMMVDLQKKYNWVLNTRIYSTKETLVKNIKKGIIEPAMEKHNELRLIKAQIPEAVSLDDIDE